MRGAGYYDPLRAKEPELDSTPSKNVVVPQIYAAHEMLAVDTTVAALETNIEAANETSDSEEEQEATLES